MRGAAHAARPKRLQRSQLDLAVQQEIDPVEPGFRSGFGVSGLGKRRAKTQQFGAGETAAYRRGQEHGLVEDHQHVRCAGPLADLRQ
jgi:hypothetical protein